MQKSSPTTLSESSSIMTEIDVERTRLVVKSFVVVETNPSFVFYPFIAYWGLIMSRTQVCLVRLRAPLWVSCMRCKLLVYSLLATCLCFFAYQQSVIHTAQFIAATKVHVVKSVLLHAFHFNFLNCFEEDTAVTLLFCICKLEVRTSFIFVVCVWDLFFLQCLYNFATENVVVENLEFLRPINIDS